MNIRRYNDRYVAVTYLRVTFSRAERATSGPADVPGTGPGDPEAFRLDLWSRVGLSPVTVDVAH